MNSTNLEIGVARDQVEIPSHSLDLTPTISSTSIPSFNNSPDLTVFSASISISERHKSPINLTICTLIMCFAAGFWLVAGYLVQDLSPVYDYPAMLTYISITSLQIYFFLIPHRPLYPKRREDGSSVVVETDLGFDTYTNREAFKLASYLFVLFTLSIGLIIKGLSMFPQSSYCGSVALLSASALFFMIIGLKSESITRYKVISILLLTISAGLTIMEPTIWDRIEWTFLLNYGFAVSIIGVLTLALFFAILSRKVEHTHIHKPLVFAFIGLFCMLFMWIVLIPFHVFNYEALIFPPPQEQVYWSILGIVLFGTVLPFYMIQWVSTRTSVLYVCVLLGAIIPLHGISEAIYLLEFNWVNLVASIISLSSIFLINFRYK